MNTAPCEKSVIDEFKTRLDLEIREERWDAADQTRVAAKRRLLEMVRQNCITDEFAAVRDALVDSCAHLRFSNPGQDDRKSGNLTKRDLAERLLVDAETAAILTELAPVLKDIMSLGNEIIDCIKDDPERKWTAGDLGVELNRSSEEIAFVLSRLRAEHKIVSLQMGREAIHRLHSSVLEGKPESDRKQENENEYSPV